MAERSPIVALLKQKSVEELEAMRRDREEAMQSAEFELRQIEEALRGKRPTRTRRTAKRGNTRKRVLEFLSDSADPATPAQIREGLNATGPEVGSSAVHNQLAKLMKNGQIERIGELGDSRYRLTAAARNGDRAEKVEGAEDPLSRVTASSSPHEGRS